MTTPPTDFPNFTEQDVQKAVDSIDWEEIQKEQVKIVAKYDKIFEVDREFLNIVIDR